MVVSAVDAVVVVDKLCVIWFSKDIWFSIKKQGRQSAQNTAIENTKTQTMKANNLLYEVQ